MLQVVTDLVQGEFMQLGSKETENERFAHYLTKTYRKTASLIANSVKAVSTSPPPPTSRGPASRVTYQLLKFQCFVMALKDKKTIFTRN
jgi:hypothetical protein